MIIVLSPAKKLLKESKPYPELGTQPLFLDKTAELAELMKSKSVNSIAKLMDLSKDLAQLNYDRYQHFVLNNAPSAVCHPALFLFQGDVYQGLNAASWDKKDIDYAQSHLRILSGLYGILRPLDLIQAYRLEMGVHLKNPLGKNLYDFWQQSVTNELNQQLKSAEKPLLVNLASNEYMKVIDQKSIQFSMLNVHFYEQTKKGPKIIGIHAKKARGVMAKFLIQNQMEEVSQIRTFNELGYQFNKELSSDGHLSFLRK